MERALVTISIIEEIKKHENADLLEIATIRGWQCVVKKDEFKQGDKVVFFEIDSFLPIKEEFEFLRKNCYRNHPDLGEGFKLKTVKLRGELSQGLVMPLSILNAIEKEWEVNEDVTEVLNIKKYEVPLSKSLRCGNPKGNFPFFIQKTDQNRIQNCWKFIKDCSNWEVTEKMDGSSCTVYYNEGFGVGVCSRNFDLKLDDDSSDFVKAAKNQNLLFVLENMKENLAIQGELCGPGIQGNKYKLNKPVIFIFDIWDIDKQRYLSKDERDLKIVEIKKYYVDEEKCKVKEVPYLGTFPIEKDKFDLKYYLEFADGKSALNKNCNREGVVFKSVDRFSVRSFESFKIISNKFLLAEE